MYIYTVTVAFYLFFFSLLSLSLFPCLHSIHKNKEEDEEEEEIHPKQTNSNKSENSSQILTKNPFKNPNQPKTQADTIVTTAMEAWVEYSLLPLREKVKIRTLT